MNYFTADEQAEETGLPFTITAEGMKLLVCKAVLRNIVAELVKCNDARGCDFTTLIRKAKAACRVNVQRRPAIADQPDAPLASVTIYRRFHADPDARPIQEEDCRADVMGTPAYPWKWLGVLFGGQAFITDAAVYALDPHTAEKVKPEGFPFGGRTS